ncbi:MAG: hypothetical protein R2751_07865 [Bacteroidales bacterium]
MMELKSALIHRISEINDTKFLEAIKTILDEKAEDSSFELTEEQKKEIEESREEIRNGFFVTGSEMDSEVQKWLNAK